MSKSWLRGGVALALVGFAACGESPTRPPRAVATVVVGPGVNVIAPGTTRQFVATLYDANGNPLDERAVAWSIDDASTATISPTGLVTALPNALATDKVTVVRATVETKTGSANLSVLPSPAASIAITPFVGTLDDGESPTLTAVVRDADNTILAGRTVTWTSRDLTAASVNTAGVMTPVAFLGASNKTVRIVASIGAVRDSIEVTVTPTTLSAMLVQPRAPFVQAGWTKTLRTEGTTAQGAAVTGLAATYTSSQPAVATVTAGGVVTVPPGASGTTQIIATFGDLADTVTLTVDACGAAPGGTFPLQVRFFGEDAPSPAVLDAFNCAAARIRAIIREPVSLVPLDLTGAQMLGCIDEPTALNDSTSGLIIFAKVDSIDGPGAVLGSAGPCFVRETSRIPVVGVMQFDRSDLANMEANGTLASVIMHEMLHVIGIGTSWRDGARNPQLWTGDVPNPGFTGALAKIACVDDHGGATTCATHVPIEDCVGISGCGAGTRLGHWRELIFRRELMTGYVSPPGQQNPFSRMTIQALADLGYVVDPHQSNDYVIPPPSLMSSVLSGAAARERALPAPRLPTHEIDAFGRLKPIPR